MPLIVMYLKFQKQQECGDECEGTLTNRKQLNSHHMHSFYI